MLGNATLLPNLQQVFGQTLPILRGLRQHPQLGRPVEDMPSEFRDLVIPFGDGGYVMRYRYAEAEDTVYVLAIRHQREAGFKPF